MSEKDIIQDVTEFRKEAEMGQHDWRERAAVGSDFYRGRQWDPAVVEALKAARKPALTINHVLPLVNFFTGVQRQSRKDIKVLRRKGGNQAIARVLTGLCKHTMDLATGEHEISACFEQGIKCGKGWVMMPITRDMDPFNGELGVEQINCFDVWEDPAAKEYDLNESCKFVIRRRWVDKEQLELRYPKQKDAIAGANYSNTGDSSAWANVLTFLTGEDGDENSEFLDDGDGGAAGRKFRYCVQETWWKDWQLRTHVRDRRSEDRMVLDPGKTEDRVAIERLMLMSAMHPDVFEIKRDVVTPILNVALNVGQVLLEHIEDPFDGCSLYPMVRFSPYWHDGDPFGVVDNLVSPQEEENKRRSQALHLLNQTSNSGWIVNKLQKGMRAILERFGSVAGVVIERDKCGGFVEKIVPNQLSAGHMTLAASAADDMKSISGVNHANMGEGAREAGESGRLNALKQRQGLTVSEVVFDNLDQTCKFLATTMVELIRHSGVYDEGEIAQLIDEKDLIDPVHINEARQVLAGKFPPPQMPDMMRMRNLEPEDQELVFSQYRQAIDSYTQQMEPMAKQLAKKKLFTQMKAWKTGRYGVVISESISAPTTRMERLIELTEILRAFPGVIPPEVFIKATSLDDEVKEECIESIRRQAQAAAQQAGAA